MASSSIVAIDSIGSTVRAYRDGIRIDVEESGIMEQVDHVRASGPLLKVCLNI